MWQQTIGKWRRVIPYPGTSNVRLTTEAQPRSPLQMWSVLLLALPHNELRYLQHFFTAKNHDQGEVV